MSYSIAQEKKNNNNSNDNNKKNQQKQNEGKTKIILRETVKSFTLRKFLESWIDSQTNDNGTLYELLCHGA